MKKMGCNAHDLRFKMGISTFQTHISYIKCSFIAHVMRNRDNSLAKQAVQGRFFPELDGMGEHNYFMQKSKMPGIITKGSNGETVMGNVRKWLVNGCKVPEGMIDYFFSGKEYGRDLLQKVMRERYIEEILIDWGKGNHVSEEDIAGAS